PGAGWLAGGGHVRMLLVADLRRGAPTRQRVPLDRLVAVSSPVAVPRSASGPPGRCPCSAVQLRCTRTDRTAGAPVPLLLPPRPRPSTPTDRSAAWSSPTAASTRTAAARTRWT